MNLLSYLLRYLISFLLLILFYSIAILVGLISRSAAWQIIVLWNRIFLKMFGVEVIVEFENKNFDFSSGGVVVGLTQQSLIDPIIGQLIAPKVFMSIWNIEYALIPFIRSSSWILGWVIIRQLPKQSGEKLRKQNLIFEKGGLFIFQLRVNDLLMAR